MKAEGMHDTDLKYFTRTEARMTLPLVKNIVRDILDTGFLIKSLAEALEGNIDNNAEIGALLSKLNAFMTELEEIGCFYKDWSFTKGLVDFPAKMGGEEVYLCWQGDEEDILYYHEMEDGLAGRKRIPPQYM